MTAKDFIDAALKLIELLTAWPIVLLIIILLFRHQIKVFLPELTKRLSKAEFGTNKFEFSSVALDALHDTLISGADAYRDNPDQLASFVRDQALKLSGDQPMSVIGKPLLLRRIILWVDDEPLSNAYETGILQKLGANVVFARSSDEAFRMLNEHKVDLIISKDVLKENGQLNPEAGYELLDRVNKNMSKILFVLYTSNASALDRERAKSAYGTADLPKQLLTVVMEALNVH